MSDQSYNGWSGYPTWVAMLWIDNEQGSYQAAREIVADVFADEHDEVPRVTAADALRVWAEEMIPEIDGMGSDLLGWAFQQINWLEIVDSIRSEV